MLFPADIGFLGLADVGRTFMDDRPSDKWYAARGGGIWVAAITGARTLRVSWAESKGRSAVYFGMGFAY